MRTTIADGLFALNINCICCAFGPSSIASRGLLFGAPPHTETASRNSAPEWDALSGRGFKRKLYPGFDAQNGMRFPVEASNGKCVPEYGSSLGCIFRLKPQAETASRNSVSERVVLSGSPLNRKLCPGIMPQNGTRFPLAWPLGKHGPDRGVRSGDARPSSSYRSTSLSHVGRAVCRMPAVCSFLASIPAERTSFMVKRSRGWP